MSEILKVIKEWYKPLLETPNVTGVGTASKEIVITVSKVDAKTLANIPTQIEGIPVKIIQAGPFYMLQARTDRWRPMVGGISIGHYKITAGTLSCMVRDIRTGEVLLLSNNHVFAMQFSGYELGEKGDPILQPGPYDGGTLPNDKVGELERWIKVYLPSEVGQPGAGKGLNLIDAAVAKPTLPDIIKPTVLDIGRPVEPYDAKAGTKVRKSGRTTGLTYGTVVVDNFVVNVYIEKGSPLYYTFTDQLFIQPPPSQVFAQPGDSGSLTTLSTTSNPVGLLFAGDEDGNGVVCKAKHIVTLLQIEFLPPLPYIPIASAIASYSATAGILQFIIPRHRKI
ncbi:MAG: hypothetical protein QXH03_02775 [Candidatus Bathyarchaeia archaeon]